MRCKIQFKNRFTDLSLEINPLYLSTKTGFHASNRRSLLSEFELKSLNIVVLGEYVYYSVES
jgi:hypothetical protein